MRGQLPVAEHGFHEIIVGVCERHIDLGMSGQIAYAVAEDKAAVGAYDWFIDIGRKGDDDLFRYVEILAGFGGLNVVAELDEGGGHDRGG